MEPSELIYEVIENRISYFKERYHQFEAIKLNEALQVIKNLIPPSDFNRYFQEGEGEKRKSSSGYGEKHVS